LAEELGFAGATLVIALFFVLLYRVLRTAVLSRDNYGMFVVVGIFAMFFFHIFVNVGMNLGILPVVGIPLPLLSYGGTSVIITFITLGIIQNIIRRHKKIDFVR
nr:FtsW/RodA/SpoVE family cell cycle protein [Candidatus Aenigmarchaeota archaeon]